MRGNRFSRPLRRHRGHLQYRLGFDRSKRPSHRLTPVLGPLPHQADAGTDLRFVQKYLRHASIETTGIYLHTEDDRRHGHTVGEEQEPQPALDLSQ